MLSSRLSNSLSISQFMFSVSIRFFIFRSVYLTSSVCFLSPFSSLSLWPPGRLESMATLLITPLANSSMRSLSTSLCMVMWALFSDSSMDRQVLSVRISKDAIMMPVMDAKKRITLPRKVWGQQSPYPTVPIVIITHHRLLEKMPRELEGTLSSLSRTISPKTNSMVTKITSRKQSGLLLKRHLNPKQTLHLVPQILQMRLPRVDKQTVADTIAEYTKYTRASSIISRMLFAFMLRYCQQIGYFSDMQIPCRARFGWMARKINSAIRLGFSPQKLS